MYKEAIVSALREKFKIRRRSDSSDPNTHGVNISTTITQYWEDLVSAGISNVEEFQPNNTWAAICKPKINALFETHTSQLLPGHYDNGKFKVTMKDKDFELELDSDKIHVGYFDIMFTLADRPALKIGATRFRCAGVYVPCRVTFSKHGIHINRRSHITNVISPIPFVLKYRGETLYPIK